jgi:hypothetical protein
MLSTSPPTTPTVGPGLTQLLEAQRWADEAVSWPHLEGYARSLVELQQADGRLPAVWPVDAAAERLAGAAALLGGPTFRLRGWGQALEGEHVLLVAVVLLEPTLLVWASRQARALGASSVAACGVYIEGTGAMPSELDHVTTLQATSGPQRRSA